MKKIEILGWESQGLRCPDVEIDLKINDEIAPVVLIQMPNGTGKTTTLTMIRAAMNGEARNWSADKIRSFRRPGESRSEGFFTLHLWVDRRPLTFELMLDFDGGKAEYATSSPGSGGWMPNWEPPPEARPFFDDRFVKLFIFDGEFADKLLDSRESEASKAIEALFQLYLLEEIKQKAEDAWVEETKDKTAKSKQGQSLYKNKVKRLKAQMKKVEGDRQQIYRKLSELEPEIEMLEGKIDEQISTQENLGQELEAKKEKERDARRDVEDSALEVMTRMRQPHLLHEAFARSLLELKDQLDRLRLPASTSSQFFTELLEEKDCICGRPLDRRARKQIAKRSQYYLAEDTSGIINALKQDIDVQVRQEGNETAANLTEELERLGRAVDNKLLAETEVRVLERESIDRGDDELKTWAEERDSKRERQRELEKRLQEINRAPNYNDGDTTQCLASLKKQLKEAKEKLAEISDTLELRAKTTVLQTIMDVAVTKARANLQEAIRVSCNQRLKKVLSREYVRIKKIDRCLQLRDQEGASVGQTLSVGYVFLATLLDRGRHQFPLIVDSPANPLDLEVRREIARLIPDLCEQFVAFTISSERAGFTEDLDASSGKRTKFLTLFRRSASTEALMRSLPHSGVTQTSNGVLVEGKDYFDSFDLEKVED
ncbi:MAG: hypothetical protein SXA11_14255 [Cyanobacteriota bacterium]|nr:hypothetical protein [Cyanobacteriota bacterium]